MSNLNKYDILHPSEKETHVILEKISNEYDLIVNKISFPRSISFTSRKLILHTTHGDLFLKEKPFYSSELSQMELAFNFQNFCCNNTDCVLPIIKTKNGKYFFEVSERFFFITPYVTGRNYNGTEKDIENMFNSLKIMSGLGEEYLKKLERYKINETFDISKMVTLIKKPELSLHELEILTNLLDVFEVLKNKLLDIPTTRYSVAHCDCILFNFLFTENNTIINDFDNVKIMPRVHDFAEFYVSSTLLNYQGEITNLKKPIFIAPASKYSKQIIKLMNTHLEFDETEWKQFPICVEYIWLWTLALSVIKGDYSLHDLEQPIKTIKESKIQSDIRLILNNIK